MAYGSRKCLVCDDIREYHKDIEKLKRALELCKAENKLQRETIDSLNKTVALLNEKIKGF